MTLRHHVALAIAVMTVGFCTSTVVASQQAQTQQTTPQQDQPAANPPQAQPAQAQPTTTPSQGCEQTKDTCELPPETAQPATPAAAASPAEKQTAPAKPATSESKKTVTMKKKTLSKKAVRKKKHTASTDSGPRRIVVRDGGTSEPRTQLSPATQQAAATRQSTDELLASTQANLNAMSARPLNANQQATIDQIKMFMEQANSALKAGDVQRAHNLAMKAHLLSDDLLRH